MIIHGYSEEELKKLPDNSVDLIITSPPYADRRKNTYGGIAEDKYVEWFKLIAIEVKRVLSPNGSFFLNIKPHTNKGERSLYVFDLVIMLKRELGFRFSDEFTWTKLGVPGKFKGRFKNAFEPVYHFTLQSDYTHNPYAVAEKAKEVSLKRYKRKACGESQNGSGFAGMRKEITSELALPSNHLHIPQKSNQHTIQKNHSAVFPVELSTFFIKAFSNEGDVVLDIFGGSGTVAVSCIETNRDFIIIEKEAENIDLIKKRVEEKRKEKDLTQKTLFGDGM
jgi:site-specific DNA-methyltransferase (adenine-specific)/site-specific DNA-methyltransferase (cytosine-N4-specific)